MAAKPKKITVPIYRLPYSAADITFVQKHIEIILKRGYLTDGGDYGKSFEEKFATLCGSKHAVATNSCTTALELILKVIQVQRKSVIVPTYTFYATPLAVINAGGKPVFADISRQTLSLSLASIKKHARKDTKAVIIVHVAGVVTPEIAKIRSWCDAKGITLIEDAACAHGASWQDKRVGTFGHAAAFSFHHSKVLTTGEGGMITTQNDEWARKLRMLRAVGLDRTRNNWEVFALGNNYKMSEITAVLGWLHMKNAERIFAERRAIAKRYDLEISFSAKLQPFIIPVGTTSAYYKYVVLVQQPEHKDYIRDKLRVDHDVLLPPNVYDHLCHDQRITKKTSAVNWQESFIHSEYMRDHTLCLPLYNGLTIKEQTHVIESLNQVLATI